MADFEPNYLRKTYRLKLPAEVVIEGKKFKVLDWSYEGFGIEKSPEDIFVEGKDYLVTFILPFASFHVSFKARAILKWQTDTRAGFQFLKLSDEIKQMLRSYVEAYIEGRLEDVGGVLAPAKVQVIPPQVEKPLTEEEKRILNLKFILAGFLYTLGFVFLVVIFFLIFVYFTNIKSVEAFVSGNIIHILSPTNGYIKRFFVREGERVKKYSPLVLIESKELKEKYEKVKLKLLEYNLKLSELKPQKKELINQLKLFQGVLEKLKERKELLKSAYNKGLVSYSDLEKLDDKIIRLIQKINQIRAKLKIINEVERNIKDLKLVERELLQENQFAKLVDDYLILLSSPEDGRIVSRFRNPGEYIKQGEPIVILEVNTKDLYIIARFKEDEGKFINVGDKAEVYFPNIDKYSDGVVIGIGKAALSEESLVSETEEYALRDVPVKVKLINPPEGLHYGMKAEVLIETKHYKPFIFTFIQNLLR